MMMKPIRILGGALLATLTAFAVATTPLPASAGQKFCPPGLAKKKNCTPPGQLKKWTKGRALPHDIDYRPLSNWSDYDLSPPPSGYVYGQVDDDILLIRRATRLVVDVALLAAFSN
jgi:Nickel/cobalt transporter regulator